MWLNLVFKVKYLFLTPGFGVKDPGKPVPCVKYPDFVMIVWFQLWLDTLSCPNMGVPHPWVHTQVGDSGIHRYPYPVFDVEH